MSIAVPNYLLVRHSYQQMRIGRKLLIRTASHQPSSLSFNIIYESLSFGLITISRRTVLLIKITFLKYLAFKSYSINRLKLHSEIVWHRFFTVSAFIRRFRSYIAVRKLFLKTSPNVSSRFRGCGCFWQGPDILRKIRKFINASTD